MTSRQIATAGWIWAIVVAALSEFPYLALLGLTGLTQAVVILFLAWLLLRHVRGPAVVLVIVALACMNGPPVAMAPTMFQYSADSSGVIDMTKPTITLSSILASLPILAVRSAMMLIALLPVGILRARAEKPK